MTPTKQFSSLLYALAEQVRNRQAVMIPPGRIEDAAERLDTLTVTIRGLEIDRDEWIACHAKLYKQRDELLAALEAATRSMRAFTDQDGNMPADTGEFNDLKSALFTANSAIASVKGGVA